MTIDDAEAGNDFLGLFGYINDGEVKNLGLERGSLNGDYRVGGLVGSNSGSISNCYSTGDVNGIASVGGLVGTNGFATSGGPVPGWIDNCYSTGWVTASGYSVGGLVGDNMGSISNCYSTGDVNGTGSAIGGLVGFNWGTVSNCHSIGDVNANDGVGGLVGVNGSVGGVPSVPGYINNSYSTGNVSGGDHVGGLVGSTLYGAISNCYSTGDVTGNSGIGGLVGANGYWFFTGWIDNCYSTGPVSGDWHVGGLVGCNEVGEIDGAFWDVQTSSEPNMCGYQKESWATGCDPNCGKTTAEMQTRSTFTEAGWDFIEIWLINEGATYPVLRQEIRSDLNGAAGVDLADFAVFADHWLEGKAD